MIKYVVDISMTAKNSDGLYYTFNDEKHTFKTLEEAIEFVKETYGSRKPKSKVFQDINGKSVQTGWLFGFWSQDYCQGCSDKKYLEEDWVTISKVVSTPINPMLWK